MESRRRCQAVAERCEALLAELMLIEKQSESNLRQRRDETAARLKGAESAGEARRAYAAAPAPARSQFDISSEA